MAELAGPVLAEPFARRVADTAVRVGPLCAGIDPMVELLDAWGLGRDAAGARELGLRAIDAWEGVVGVVKPQVAFFEQFGSPGFAALEAVMRRARDAGMIVIADAKRGDIGSTAAGYAAAWLEDGSPLVADAVTAFAYMGLGSIRPMIDAAAHHRRGVIVVVRSSNPEGRSLQSATVDPAGTTVEDALLAEIAAVNAEAPEGGGPLGAVVGATLSPSAFDLAGLGGVILAPGVGEQGAGPAEVAALFGGCAPGSVVANVSRAILRDGPDRRALRDAAVRQQDALRDALSVWAPRGRA